MAGKNLDIFLNLDLGQSLAKTGQIVEAEKQIAREALNSGKAQEKARADAVASTERATAAFTAMAVDGATRVAREVAAAFGQAAEAAAVKMKAVSDKFSGTRDSVRELANLQGKQAGDPAFLRDFAQFNRETGMRRDESIAFQSQLLNSGAQFVGDEAGKNIGVAESREFARQAAALSVARGANPDVAGDLAGRILGTTDFKKFGDQGSEVALGRFNAPLAILDAGVGKSAQLMNQYNMLLGTAFNEDEAKGAFSDVEEMATVISVQAQKSVGRSFTGVRAAMKGVRDFDNPLIKKAGITPKTKFQDAIRMLAPVVQAEADARGDGSKPIDILNEYFEDDLTAEGIGTQIEQGVNQRLYDKRAEVGRRARGPEAGLAKIAEFRKTGTFLNREADAFNEQVDIEKGIVSADVDILRKQSIGELRRDKKLDTTGSEMQKYLQGKLAFGLVPDRDRSMVDSHVLGMLSRRGDKGLYSYGGELGFPGVKGYTPEGREEYLNERIAAAKAQERDPFHDPKPAAIAGPPRWREELPAALPSGPDPKFDGR